MIKFLATGADGKPLLGIGLSRNNCELLLSDKPIHLVLSEMLGEAPIDAKELRILLFAGETEESMTADLIRAGAQLPTEVREHYEENHE